MSLYFRLIWGSKVKVENGWFDPENTFLMIMESCCLYIHYTDKIKQLNIEISLILDLFLSFKWTSVSKTKFALNRTKNLGRPKILIKLQKIQNNFGIN